MIFSGLFEQCTPKTGRITTSPRPWVWLGRRCILNRVCNKCQQRCLCIAMPFLTESTSFHASHVPFKFDFAPCPPIFIIFFFLCVASCIFLVLVAVVASRLIHSWYIFKAQADGHLSFKSDRWKAHAPELLRWPVWRSGLLQLRVIHQADSNNASTYIGLKHRALYLWNIIYIIYTYSCKMLEIRWIFGNVDGW